MFLRFSIIICIVFTFTACSVTNKYNNVNPELPLIEREFRGAWVATVANINWPSKPGLSVDSLKIEAKIILDRMQSMNFNAVIFQARPQADALYKSSLEPWSYYLTREQGKAPEQSFDPLEYWIEQSHLRNMDLHVWVNPYRAHHIEGGPVSPSSVVNNPKLGKVIHKLASGYYWFEPTSTLTQDHSYAVIMDIVKRYNVDGIHMDDYFYPYPSYNDDKDFPDDESYQAYVQKGGKLSRGDWRRDAVNVFVKRVHEGIKKEKPYVLFGISPFGIWRPGFPNSIKGFDQYDQLYADVRLWTQKGWLDYLAPQLYWPINKIPQSFPVLLDWWHDQNLKNKHMWPGISVANRDSSVMIDEAFNKIMITRGMKPQDAGIIHWSIAPHMKSDTLAKALKNGPYNKQALIPYSPWISKKAPNPPSIKLDKEVNGAKITWSHPDKANLSRIIVYKKYNSEWDYEIYPIDNEVINLRSDDLKQLNEIRVQVMDKTGNLSKLAVGL